MVFEIYFWITESLRKNLIDFTIWRCRKKEATLIKFQIVKYFEFFFFAGLPLKDYGPCSKWAQAQ